MNPFRSLAPVVIALLITVMTSVSIHTAKAVEPPIAKVEPKIDTFFNVEMVDNYFWLRDKEDSEVIDHLKAENEYTESVMAPQKKLREDLFTEMKARIKETDLSVPVKDGDYYYYSRDEKGKQYKIYCRKKGSLEGKEEILIDVNILAEGHKFLDLGTFDISPDHTMLCFSTDTAGNERYVLQFKNLITGEILPDRIENCTGDVAWANDNKTLFYTIPDEAWRPYKLFRHSLGTKPDSDIIVLEESDESFWMGIGRTRSNKYLIVDLGSNTTTESYFLSADNPTGSFALFAERIPKVEYSVYHYGDKFLVVTNENATNFKLIETPLDRTSRENWKDLIPHRDNIKLDGIDIFKDFMVVYQRENGLKTIEVWNHQDGNKYHITFPEPDYTFSIGENPDYNQTKLRFTYMSLITPNSVYDYDMNSQQRELLKRKEVLGKFSSDDYTSERIYATAPDGTKVPISLVYKKGLKKDGSNPTMMRGYGAYGWSYDTYFSTNRLSLLNRGFIYAIAHIRGGGEMGRPWYDNGKLMNKKNTFTDFIACAEYLISQGYTKKERLSVGGGSAGGLLIGAVLNMRPDLFQAVVADVPFVDLINTMMDETIPLTVIEYEEWGNPHEKDAFEYMLSYSPYDNVKQREYPNLLIMAGLNDTRVGYWEPAKWTAKLRAMNKSNNLLLLNTNMGAGHGGSSGRYDYLKEIALEYAFLMRTVGGIE